MAENIQVNLGDNTLELPVIIGTEGEKGIDVSSLRSKSGYITLDPSYGNTGSCTSDITFVDGENGILRYRGIPIEELAEKSNFLETAYLLINGDLPNKDQLTDFSDDIMTHTMLHEGVKRFYDGFPRDAHPMATLASVICALSTFYQDEVETPEEMSYINAIRLLAKLPTVAAYSYKQSIGQPFMYPDTSLGYCENFLHMMFATPISKYEADPELVKALDMLLIIHADHEQNCSTSTVRLVRSSMTNLFACIASGICALWGPRHGGANQRVIEMLQDIKDSNGNVKKHIERVKNKEAGAKLMGFGHRVYKNFDPRAKIIKQQCDKLFAKLKIADPLLDIAKELEEAALNDEYFIERKLYPNVDFYSGIIYKAMGIPVPAFPVMFALGRLPGWIAHAREFSIDPTNRIGRPRQIYTGEAKRSYVALEKR